jgi:hypothetical protein
MNTEISTRLITWVTRYSPWLAPVPTAAAIFNAGVEHLGWSAPVALICALFIEGQGISTSELALDMYSYNRSRESGEPTAPTWIALLTVSVYLVTVILLAVLIDVFPALVRWVTAVIPLVGMTGYVTLALRKDHDARKTALRDRQADADDYERQRKALALEMEREHARLALELERTAQNARLENRRLQAQATAEAKVIRAQAAAGALRQGDAGPVKGDSKPLQDPVKRRQALYDLLCQGDTLNITALSGSYGVSRPTIYADLEALQKEGKAHKNGNGWEAVR